MSDEPKKAEDLFMDGTPLVAGGPDEVDVAAMLADHTRLLEDLRRRMERQEARPSYVGRIDEHYRAIRDLRDRMAEVEKLEEELAAMLIRLNDAVERVDGMGRRLDGFAAKVDKLARVAKHIDTRSPWEKGGRR